MLEGGDAVCFASGMAAVAAVFDHVPLGGVIVLPHDGYYGTRAFADSTVAGRWEIRPVEISDTDAVVAACRGLPCCGWSRQPIQKWTSPIFRRSVELRTPKGCW